MSVTWEKAAKIVEEAQKAAKKTGGALSVAVVDQTGQLVSFARSDGALPASAELARVKAETSVLFTMPTKDLGAASALATALSRPTAFIGGGVPLLEGGKVVGGLGIAGGMPDQDHEIALAAAKVFGS